MNTKRTPHGFVGTVRDLIAVQPYTVQELAQLTGYKPSTIGAALADLKPTKQAQGHRLPYRYWL